MNCSAINFDERFILTQRRPVDRITNHLFSGPGFSQQQNGVFQVGNLPNIFHMSCDRGDKLFNAGDPTDFFYILLKGQIGIESGKSGPKLYTAKSPGEIVGWSALIRNEDYTATATIESETELLKLEREPFLKLLEKSPANKALLFERVAKMLGNRLLKFNPPAV